MFFIIFIPLPPFSFLQKKQTILGKEKEHNEFLPCCLSSLSEEGEGREWISLEGFPATCFVSEK